MHFCSEFPLTPSGKLNRTALSEALVATFRPEPEADPDLESIEERVRTLWKAVLGVETIAPDDRFFQSGGDSLLATQLVNRLQKTFNIEFSIRNVFESATLREQASRIAEIRSAAGTPLPTISRVPREEGNKPFCLERDFLWRVTLIKISSQHHVLLWTNHHIISDRWSTDIFFDELMRQYSFFNSGKPLQLTDLPVQYRDFACHQRQIAEHPHFENQMVYWKKQLAEVPTLSLHAHWSARSPGNFEGTKESIVITGTVVKGIHLFCRQVNVTPFMYYSSVLQILLSRYSGQTDVCIGTPISGRSCTEIEQLLGFFANTLVIRGDLSGNPAFREFLSRTRKASIEGFSNQDMPFEKVVEAMNPPRSSGHSPLFDVVITLIASRQNMKFEDLEVTIGETSRNTVKFPLQLALEETNDGLIVSLHYSTCLFEEQEIKQMLRHFHNLLVETIANPEQTLSALPMLSADEEKQILGEWSCGACDVPTGVSIPEAFQQTAEQFPGRIAVQCDSNSLTYDELNRRANSLATFSSPAGHLRKCRWAFHWGHR